MGFIDWIRRAFDLISRLWKKVPGEIKEYTSRALEITNGIKRVLDGDGVLLITALIPGNWDDRLVARIKDILNKGIPELVNVEGCGGDLQCYLVILVDFIKEQAPKTRNSILLALAQLIVAGLDNHRLKESQYDAYTSMGYTANKYVG